MLRDLPWCTGNFFYAPVYLSPGVFTALRSVSKFCISVLFIPPAHWAWLWWRSPSLKAVAISAVRWLNVQRWRADTDAIVSFRKITCTAHTHIQKDTPPPTHRYAYVASACAPDLAHSGDGHALVHLNESVLRPTSSSIVCTEEVWSNLPLCFSLAIWSTPCLVCSSSSTVLRCAWTHPACQATTMPTLTWQIQLHTSCGVHFLVPRVTSDLLHS